MKVTIYGASDDLVEIKGDISNKIDCPGISPKLYFYNENGVLEFCVKTSFKHGFWKVYPVLDEKTFDENDINSGRLSKNWKINVQMGGFSNHDRNSMILEIDSYGDFFEIVKKRKKIKQSNKKSVLTLEQEYWDLVNKLNWSINHSKSNYLDIARKTVKDNKNNKKLENFFRKLKNNLSQVFDEYVENEKDLDYPLGDDSTADFLSHICGESKEAYDLYFNNPDKMYNRAKKEGYLSESFSWVWFE